MKNEFSNIVSKINAGSAILFTGAGFSKDSSNRAGESKLPLSEELSEKICKLGNFDISKNLMYSADRYIRDNKDNDDEISKLILLLKETFTVTTPSDSAKKICSAPWSKYYTTNYDDTIEKSTHGIVSVDTGASLNEFEVKDRRCVHINGFIGELTAEDLDKSFKLSETSYLSPEGFLRSPWYTVFKRDLVRSSILVFVGYSLYDIDIKRILVEIEGLKDRTYFIVKDSCGPEEEYTFSRHGKVLKIGIDGFAALIEGCTDFIDNTNDISCLHINKYVHSNQAADVNDTNIENLLLLGTTDDVLIENDVLSKKNNYVVFRDKIETVMQTIEHDNVIITSEFGNGKTLFIKEALPFLANKFKYVYEIYDPHVDYLSDIEKICSNYDDIVVFVVDDYASFVGIFEYLAAFDRTRIRFLLAARSGKHESQKKILTDCNFNYKEFAIDILSDKEQSNLANLIDSIGFWGKEYVRKADKNHFIAIKCRHQISLVLLSLLDSQHIKEKVQKIISKLILNDNDLKYATVMSLYLCTQDIKVDTSLVSELAGNFIYDSKIIKGHD